MLSETNTKSIRFCTFKESWSKLVTSWIRSDEELFYWSGRTFQEGFSENTFRRHRNRSNLICLALTDLKDHLIAYGEILLEKKALCTLCRVIVRPQERRSGYGRIFCKSAMQWAACSLNCKTMRLNVLKALARVTVMKLNIAQIWLKVKS